MCNECDKLNDSYTTDALIVSATQLLMEFSYVHSASNMRKMVKEKVLQIINGIFAEFQGTLTDVQQN